MLLLYIIKRVCFIPLTLFFIILINFLIVQVVPGGPVEVMMSRIKNMQNMSEAAGTRGQEALYKASQGIEQEFREYLVKLYGFDKPAYERFWLMLKNYSKFDFGNSYFKNQKVIDLIISKFPVSISLGLWSTLLIYLISIPLGIYKAVNNGSKFDLWSSFFIAFSYAIPGFILAIILILIFAGNGPLGYFPVRGLIDQNYESFSWWEQVKNYFWHITLPVITLTLSGFAIITLLSKNSFLEEINKQYVVTALAKGLNPNQVMYKHVFRNAMLLVITSIPDALLKILFTGALLIEVIFSLDGLGLLSYEAAVSRDYPIVFSTLFIFTLIGLIVNLITDLTYILVDPRINFEQASV